MTFKPSQHIKNENIDDAYDELHARCEALETERDALAQALENFINIDNVKNAQMLNKASAIITARQVISSL